MINLTVKRRKRSNFWNFCKWQTANCLKEKESVIQTSLLNDTFSASFLRKGWLEFALTALTMCVCMVSGCVLFFSCQKLLTGEKPSVPLSWCHIVSGTLTVSSLCSAKACFQIQVLDFSHLLAIQPG